MAILTLVGEEPRHGYQIIQELSNRSNGMWQPSPGSIYPTLQALEDEGLLSSENIEGKRVYSLTEAGRGYLSANARPTPPWEEIAGDPSSGFHTLRREIFQLGAAAMQVAQNSNEDQLARAAKILADARKSIYRMLAEDEG
ncbi:MAG: PadR family transcriptional regulator [Actinomycetota bacterium]|nr:PadR family transcriptional regulator [Actinomycetota bacterium]